MFGTPCIIAQQIKKQNKTSKYKLINWIYKKIYGYRYESILPDDTDIICINGQLIFRDENVFNRAMEVIKN